MKIFTLANFIVLFSLVFISEVSQAQIKSDSLRLITVAAGSEYKKSSYYQGLWGSNNRKEWVTPVTFPKVLLDTLAGGIKKFEEGGSNQSKSLRITSNDNKEYTLRSVNKTLGKLIPPIFKNTFIEDVVNDQISMSHPYGALVVPVMAEAANVLHTNPRYVWLPIQPKLDSFNKKYGNKLYLFEQRPKDDWSDAPNLGNFNNIIGSETLLDKLYADHDTQIDQAAFAKARLLDMLVGDWDRHWDQWKWGSEGKGNNTLYKPIPTDRDQAFSTYNGILLRTVIAATGMKFLQPYKSEIKNVNTLNTANNLLDRFFTNEITLGQWQEQARMISLALTDNVIESAVKQLPPEIFALSGKDIIAKLKSRNSDLEKYATQYYYFLAKEVEIVGSKQKEYFEVNRINDNETLIRVYKINTGGKAEQEPYYSRTFKTRETKEVRLYGLSGNDLFVINGKVTKGIRLRIIGGDQKDSIIDNSNLKTYIYDDKNNSFVKGIRTKLHLSDSTDHTFDFNTFKLDRRGRRPLLSFNNYDRLFVGLGFNATNHKWRRLPYAFKQDLGVHYSISQKAFSYFYKGIFPKVIGKWDMLLNADYDEIRWTNFYGVGNNTVLTTNNINYNRLRSKEILGSIGMERKFNKSTIKLSGIFESVEIINDTARFVSKVFAPPTSEIFTSNNYAGVQLNYKAIFLNNIIIPTKGISFFGNAGYRHSLDGNNSFERIGGKIESYIPLVSKFSLAIKSAGATVIGDPMFYQLPNIGGAEDLRGYKRERFRGTFVFTNSNELRFITNMRTHLVNGKIGLMVFYDQGRVWRKNENSTAWHTDYGAGVMIAPFNALLANITYGISKEHKLIQISLARSF